MGMDDVHDRPATLEEFLRGTVLFKGCDPAVVARIAPRVEVTEVPAGGHILRAGSPAEGLVILQRGRASTVMVNATTGATSTLETLQAGDHAGETAALLRTAQPYTVLADTACVVARVRAELFETLLQKVPTFGVAISRRLAMRMVQLGVTALRHGAGATQKLTSISAGGLEPVATSPGARPKGAPGKVIPFVEVGEYDPSSRVIGMVPARIILQHRIFPLRLVGNVLTIGMVTPRNANALTELHHVLQGVEVEAVAISVDDFLQAVARYHVEAAPRDASRTSGAGVTAESLNFDVSDSEREADKALRVIGDEVVRAVSRIIAQAISREASDIHVEPELSGVRVRYRVQGLLQDSGETYPPSFAKGIVARFKILAGLDITERRLPQDGRIGLSAGTREIDLRLSTLPSSRGEKLVIRMFEASGMMRPLEQIFVDATTQALARKALHRGHGSVFVAGGAGSGKSSTLYALIHERRKVRPDSNVLLVEDPIEYRLQGVTQVQINAGIGLGFPQVLRAAMRQDPDVIALGETRDTETARMALEAAMTGHLLVTSIHATSASGVLQRLENLGCGSTLVAQSVAVVIVQRLARRLCPQCARVEPPPSAMVESLAARRLIEPGTTPGLPRAVGCEACQGTGYAGRVLVAESLQMTEEVRTLLMAGTALGEVEKAALNSRALQPFSSYAAQLMARKMISASEALLAVSE